MHLAKFIHLFSNSLTKRESQLSAANQALLAQLQQLAATPPGRTTTRDIVGESYSEQNGVQLTIAHKGRTQLSTIDDLKG